MKQRKTRVQKTESELRQAKKTISDLEKCIAALSERIEHVHSKSEGRDVKLHNHVIATRGDVDDLRKEIVLDLNALKDTGDAMTDITAAHFDRIVRLEGKATNSARDLYWTNERISDISKRVQIMEQGFWCRLISRLLGKKVRHAAL